MTQRRPIKKVLFLLLVLFVLLILVVVSAIAGYYFLSPRTVIAKPVVMIQSPVQGAELFLERPVTIHAVANDAARIARMELWIDGKLNEAQDSGLDKGTSPFPLVSYWRPTSAGSHTITARAFNTAGERTTTSIEVEVVSVVAALGDAEREQFVDSDGDSLEDGLDLCPTEAGLVKYDGCPVPNDGDGDQIPASEDECPDMAGTLATEGCPDADGDTIPDSGDVCPEAPGGPGAPDGDGCPAPGETDRDGDGIPDDLDVCPDIGGSPLTVGCPDRDGDLVPDAIDACPDEPGLPGDDGCPVPGGREDTDGDGVGDIDDACPDEPGLPDLEGCPGAIEGDGGGSGSGAGNDTDGDGVLDIIDLCPDEPGPAANNGCPIPEDAPDSDGDGVPDDWDFCPEEPGLPEDEGCPVPGSGSDSDGDGVPDSEGGPSDESSPSFPDMDLSTVMVGVEFQAIDFEVSHDFDGLYCYPRLTGTGRERYTFESLGGRQWDIAADLGSRTLALLPTEALQVEMECGGDNLFLGPEGGWGAYYSLGSIGRHHPSSDWDGHVITVRSEGGDEGRWFEASYRICEESCDDSAFPPPTIAYFTVSGDHQLILMWSGDREAIDGFWVYADGNRAFRLPADTTSQSINGYEPMCGSGSREFFVTAYQGSQESPPSNLVYWSRRPCSRVIRVTFDEIITYAVEDERRMDGRMGPIFGSFWAQGTNEVTLPFEGADYPDGFKLSPHSVYSIQSMFDQIETLSIQNNSTWFHAPDHNTVTVELGPFDDLSIGGVIFDQDWQVYQEAFLETMTIPSSEVVPGRYTIRDRQIELSVLIDVLVGPEAGDLPDLTITDVTEFEGQLRIHLFNNAAPLENSDVEVSLTRISTSEILAVHTWENVSIPSGGERILQSGGLTVEPYDLRVSVDPDNRIEEMNDGNNIFETPAQVRVEFTGLRVPSWPCEGFLNQNGEVWFQLSVGYGPSWEHVTWVGHRVRYPVSGIVRWNRNDEPPVWSLAEQDSYIFEFELPAAENVYINMYGYEQDGSSNQSMGVIAELFGPSINYGDNPDNHYGRSSGIGATYCDAWEPLGPTFFGFEGWWRITRLH